MNKFEVFKPKSLIFAPLEGVTDEPYRLAMLKAFPEWDLFFTDFLRVPTVGRITEKHIIEHFGHDLFNNPSFKKKNSFQILTSPKAQTTEIVSLINHLGFSHLDLNLGCPSNTVNSNFGGAYLLAHPELLQPILKNIRTNFSGTFTVKMRVGYKDDKLFENLLKIIEDNGIEAITIHARTKSQLYQGVADWSYIKKAVETCQVPIIGNGDIWNLDDIERIFDFTNCHSVMFGRSAMKTPWLAHLYREWKEGRIENEETFLIYERKKFIELYFESLLVEYRKKNWSDERIHKRFKAFSRYIFDDLDNGDAIRGNFLRSNSLNQFLDLIYIL